MPIYEYVCRECGHELEKLQKLSDPPLTDCPACGEKELKRKISPAGFRLAGGGWYETDFKSEGKRNLAGDHADKKDKDKTAADKSGKTDKKADKKSKTGDPSASKASA